MPDEELNPAHVAEDPTPPPADPAPAAPPVNMEAELAKAREEAYRQAVQDIQRVPQAPVAPTPAPESPKAPTVDYSLAVTDPDEYGRQQEARERFLIAETRRQTEETFRSELSQRDQTLRALEQSQVQTQVAHGLTAEQATFARQIAKDANLNLSQVNEASLRLIQDAAIGRQVRENPPMPTPERPNAAPASSFLPPRVEKMLKDGIFENRQEAIDHAKEMGLLN